MSYLRRFPFDKIKIDRSFVADLGRSGDAAEIVRAVIHLGRGLGMRANAEGVETAEQATLLRVAGCGEGQGYYFGRPVPAHEFAALVADGSTRDAVRAGPRTSPPTA